MGDPREDIRAVSEKAVAYCEALWSSDTAMLRDLFHNRANLYGIEGDALAEYTSEAWLKIVGARKAGDGAARYTIRHVDVAAPDMASVSLDCAVRGNSFTDILNFLKIDGEWRVISKQFHAHGDA